MSDQDDEKKFIEKCHLYLVLIEREEALMAIVKADTKKVNEYQQEIAKLKRLLAKHLGDRSIDWISASRRHRVTPCWVISGQPQKRLKAQAREWMAARDLTWTGAPDLRDAVQDALEDGEQVPEGHFGLRVERTITIEQLAPRADKSASHDSPRQS